MVLGYVVEPAHGVELCGYAEKRSKFRVQSSKFVGYAGMDLGRNLTMKAQKARNAGATWVGFLSADHTDLRRLEQEGLCGFSEWGRTLKKIFVVSFFDGSTWLQQRMDVREL